MRWRIPLIVAVLFVTLLGSHAAARAVEFTIEGPISAVQSFGSSGTITVMGVTITIPAGTPINSPTATLTMSQLADPTPSPGRSQPGFIGGTAIITGEAEAGVVTAGDVFVEPAENVLGGPVTSNAPDPFRILGTTVVLLADPRIPARRRSTSSASKSISRRFR